MGRAIVGEGEDGVEEKGTGAATITIRNVSKTNPIITPTTIHTSGPALNITFPNPDILFTVPGVLKIPLINPVCPRFLSS